MRLDFKKAVHRIITITFFMFVCCSVSSIAQEQDMLEGENTLVRAYHLNRSGSGSTNLCETSIGCPTLGIWFQKPVGATYTTEIGGWVMDVNGNPTRIPAGTWPNGFSAVPGYALRLDGVGDFLSYPDNPAFEQQNFSLFTCFVSKAGVSSNDMIMSKSLSTGDKRQWALYFSSSGASISFFVSDDGTSGAGHFSSISKSSSSAPNRFSCVSVSYQFVGDGSSEVSLWVDELPVATSNSFDGPPADKDQPFDIGANSVGPGIGDVSADFYVAAYYYGNINGGDHLRLMNKVRGLYDSGAGTYVSFSSATPPATQVAAGDDGVEPYLVDQPANSGMIGKTDYCTGIYGASAITNLVQRSSFETYAAGNFAGWVKTVTSTGNCVQDTTRFAHGSSAARCSASDADDEVKLTSACLTVTGSTLYNLMANYILISGTGALDLTVWEDDSADCGSPTGHTTIGVTPYITGWTKYTTGYTTQAGTIRAQIDIKLPAGAAQVFVVDAIQFRPGGYTDAFCSADTDAPAVCTASIPSHPSALSANGSQTIEATYCTPWAGTDIAANAYLMTDGSIGANCLASYVSNVTDEPVWALYDAASTTKYNLPNTSNWAANTSYTLRRYMSGGGEVGLTWPVGSWYLTTAGAGTGIRSAAQDVTYLCSSNTAPSDSWLTGLTYYRGWKQ